MDSFTSCLIMFALAIVSSLIVITIFRFGFKTNRNIGKGVTFEKPEKYEPKQRQTLILGSCGNEEERNSLFNRLLFVAVPINVVTCAIYNLIVSLIL